MREISLLLAIFLSLWGMNYMLVTYLQLSFTSCVKIQVWSEVRVETRILDPGQFLWIGITGDKLHTVKSLLTALFFL